MFFFAKCRDSTCRDLLKFKLYTFKSLLRRSSENASESSLEIASRCSTGNSLIFFCNSSKNSVLFPEVHSGVLSEDLSSSSSENTYPQILLEFIRNILLQVLWKISPAVHSGNHLDKHAFFREKIWKFYFEIPYVSFYSSYRFFCESSGSSFQNSRGIFISMIFFCNFGMPTL